VIPLFRLHRIYYSPDLQGGSEDPIDPTKTTRVSHHYVCVGVLIYAAMPEEPTRSPCLIAGAFYWLKMRHI
jgi:hypothetical protein